MKSSQLQAILARLEAMIADDANVDVRRFERDGVERCTVTYDSQQDLFALDVAGSDEAFEFDDIDLVAMEIYDLLQ